MKAKTREKLAERGLGPGAHRRRRRQGTRAERRAAARLARAAGNGEQVLDVVRPDVAGIPAERPGPVVRSVNGVGDVVDPPSGSVRERVRLRPAVSVALDVEAARLGMTRESLCRFVLEEVARKAVEREDGAGEASGDAPAASSGAPPDALPEEPGDSAPVIPGAYVGGGADAGAVASVPPVAEAVRESEPEEQVDGAASPPVVRRGLIRRRPSRFAGWDGEPSAPGLRLGRYRRGQRLARGWALAAAVVVAAACVWAGAGYWRYAVAGAAGDGVYVLDRWEGRVWRCASTRGAPAPACRPAVFRPSPASGDVTRLGRGAN